MTKRRNPYARAVKKKPVRVHEPKPKIDRLLEREADEAIEEAIRNRE